MLIINVKLKELLPSYLKFTLIPLTLKQYLYRTKYSFQNEIIRLDCTLGRKTAQCQSTCLVCSKLQVQYPHKEIIGMNSKLRVHRDQFRPRTQFYALRKTKFIPHDTENPITRSQRLRTLEDKSYKNDKLKICYRRGNSNNERAEHVLDLRYSATTAITYRPVFYFRTLGQFSLKDQMLHNTED